MAKGFAILSQDESILTADSIFRKKMRVKKGTRPAILANGNRQKTIIFGALAHDGKRLFRQYDRFDQYCFLDYLKELRKKFGKISVYADRAPQRRSRPMQKYLDENHDVVLDWFPKGSPQFNAVGEAWKQGKYDLSVSQYRPSLNSLKDRISKHYGTARFDLDIIKYVQRGDGWRIYVREYSQV